ncbi:MAG: tetratricopeptide repeat protein [Candidatus Omnitrophica bacterium]|nr:tetratricopeptide repeat protein [Candidatus Omnitrophota bacterium]
MKRIAALLILTVLAVSLDMLASEASAQDNHPAYREGITYASEGKFREAAAWFRNNLKEYKTDSTSSSSLAVINDLNEKKITEEYAVSFFKGLDLLQNGEIDMGLAELEKTAGSNPSYARPYNVIGVVYASLGNEPEAIGYFRKAIEIDPRYGQACFNLAALYQSSNRLEDALEYYEKAISLEPDLPEASVNMAGIYASLGKYPEAIKYYRMAIELDRDNPDLYYRLSLVYFMSEQLMKFRENLLKAQKLYRNKGDNEGLKKVAEYMDKITDIENKFRKAK